MASPKSGDLLFVYGSLMKGLRNHYVLDSAEKVKYWQEGWVSGKLYQLVYDVPALRPSNGPLGLSFGMYKDSVKGEVYQINSDEIWKRLIEFERGYVPVSLTVGLNHEEDCEAWCFCRGPEISIENLTEITSGDWKKFVKENLRS